MPESGEEALHSVAHDTAEDPAGDRFVGRPDPGRSRAPERFRRGGPDERSGPIRTAKPRCRINRLSGGLVAQVPNGSAPYPGSKAVTNARQLPKDGDAIDRRRATMLCGWSPRTQDQQWSSRPCSQQSESLRPNRRSGVFGKVRRISHTVNVQIVRRRPSRSQRTLCIDRANRGILCRCSLTAGTGDAESELQGTGRLLG